MRSLWIVRWRRLKSRDPKGLYKKARAGEIKNFTGIDDPYEAPFKPEIHLHSDKQSLAEEVEEILSVLRERGIIKRNQENTMIKPHGSDELNPLFVYDTEQRHALLAEAESLPSLLVNSAAAANAVMLGGGYFNPLTGYMNLADAMSVAEKDAHRGRSVFPGPHCQSDQRERCQGGQSYRPARP